MIMAGIWMAPLWARTAGRAISVSYMILASIPKHSPMPINTKKPVVKRAKSTAAFPELSIKSSGFAHREHIQLGNGATT